MSSDDDRQRLRERLERDLAAIVERWNTPGYFERTTARALDEERQVHRELTAKLDEWKRTERATVQGGVSSTTTGLWKPLALHEAPPRRERSAARLRAAPRRDLPALEREVFDLLRSGEPPLTPQLLRLAASWRKEPKGRRLLAAALRSVGNEAAASELWPRPHAPHATPWPVASATWLNQATEVAHEFDGLTRTQRRLLQFMRQAAPAELPAVPLHDLATEFRRIDPSADIAVLERQLVGLGHPELKPLPLVELRGLTGRFDPPATHCTHARLTAIAHEVLDQTLALPLLLVNGAEGEGCWIPPHHPHEVLAAALVVVNAPGAHPEVVHHQVLGVDLATGCSTEPSRDLWVHGHATLTCSANVELEVDATRRHSQLVVRQFPWPLRAERVTGRLLQHLAAGRLEGVTSVSNHSSADEQRVVLELEHLAFAEQVKAALATSKVCSLRFDAGLVVPDLEQTRRRTTLVDLVCSFVEHRKELVVKKFDETIAAARRRAQNAEALCVALLMVDHVMQVMRTGDDDEQAAVALTKCFGDHERALLTRLPFPPSHPYETGFTLEQARHLLTVRKLASRPRDAARDDWARLRAEVERSRQALSSRPNVLEVVKAELEATLARFDQPRRSPPWPRDA